MASQNRDLKGGDLKSPPQNSWSGFFSMARLCACMGQGWERTSSALVFRNSCCRVSEHLYLGTFILRVMFWDRLSLSSSKQRSGASVQGACTTCAHTHAHTHTHEATAPVWLFKKLVGSRWLTVHDVQLRADLPASLESEVLRRLQTGLPVCCVLKEVVAICSSSIGAVIDGLWRVGKWTLRNSGELEWSLSASVW